jgi:antitoxin YefM
MLSHELTYTQARANLRLTLDEVIDNHSIIVIRSHNKPGVALIAESELTALMETIHLFRSPANARRLLDALDEADNHKEPAKDDIQVVAKELGFD